MAVKIDNAKCTGCAACVDTCPNGSISVNEGTAIVKDDCLDCAACLSGCPTEAISI